MKSARRTLLRRSGTVAPVLLLAAAATVGTLSNPGTGSDPVLHARPASFANGNPLGKVTKYTKVPGGVRVSGWAFDPNKKRRSLQIVSKVSGRPTNTTVASRTSKTAARLYPNAGSKHGFSFVVPVREGVRTVCAVAKNVKKGHDSTIGCLRRSRFDYGPTGALQTVDTRPGAVHLRGWLVDNDRPTASVTAHVTVDGIPHDLVANRKRNDVARANPKAGANHGFDASFPVAQGKHSICVTSRNIGLGTDNRFSCRSVTLNDNPLGTLTLGQRSGKMRVSGFAVDRDDVNKALAVTVAIDRSAPTTALASASRTDLARQYGVPATHGFDLRYAATEGAHTVCVTVANIGYGSNTSFGCRRVTLNYTPSAALTSVAPTVTGMGVRGWATDPDTSAPITIRLTLDGKSAGLANADAAGSTHNGHNFAVALPTKSGAHRVCVTAVNVVSGTHDAAPVCQSVTLSLAPSGAFEKISRVGDDLRVSGWAYDPDTTAPVQASVTVDKGAPVIVPAAEPRADIAKLYPSAGANRGFDRVLNTDNGEHTVCITLRNVGGGSTRNLGCKLIIAVHPVAPSAPRAVTVKSGYNAVTASWQPPASDGGAPPTSYRVVASPGGRAVTVPATARTATVTGLARKSTYRVTVTATNVAGTSPGAVSAPVTTQAGPGPQTSPAPVSTSRYLRNIRSCSASENSVLRASGRADGKRNASGHRYLQLLDIGGQSQSNGGVVLSATTRFVSYSALLTCSKAYLDGYAGAMHANAPATIAIGVNNDMDVNATTGRAWATQIVNPLVSYARRYGGITVAGANDIEPGFSAPYSATRSWLSGYLAATSAAFVFNGSADGCAWTATGRGCNNGWTMTGLYNLAAGMAPTRIVNLPQVYNYTMADQWKYISLTGVVGKHPRINFGGPLTEAVACAQAGGSCGSISGRSAWQRMWSNLQSHPKLRVGSLPYATDLRIDR